MNNMSDDLISRKEALDCINMTLNNFGIEFGDALQSALEDDLKNLQALFDKERVIEELKRNRYIAEAEYKVAAEYGDDRNFLLGKVTAYVTAIAIVEDGGIE